jgi:flagellar assembly protein FliH
MDRLQADAQAREEAARQQGQQAGYQAGHRDGQAEATRRHAAELEQIAARAAASVEEVLATRRRMRHQLEEDLVALAVSIARRVLNRELQVDPEALWGIVRAVIDKLDTREIHRLRVAPGDAPVIQARLGGTNLPERVELAVDSTLERGGLIFETARGELDASVDTQLEEIERGLTDVVRRSAP